jgi:hypothetical protein
VIQCRLNVKLNDPVVLPATLSRDGDRLFCPLARPVSIGIFMEYRIEHRLNHELGHALRKPHVQHVMKADITEDRREYTARLCRAKAVM